MNTRKKNRLFRIRKVAAFILGLEIVLAAICPVAAYSGESEQKTVRH